MERRGGQTLILIIVVVIGIASVLLLLTLPTAVSIREADRRLTCMRNLKKIGLALQMYQADYDGCLPFEGNSHTILWDGARKQKLYLGKLHPGYLKHPRSWYCPLQKLYREDSPEYGLANFGRSQANCYGSYFVRGSLQFNATLSSESAIRPDQYPEKIAWVADYNLPGTECIAHKNRGMFVLYSDASVHYARGSYSCTTETDLHGDLFWVAMDRMFADKVKRRRASVSTDTQVRTETPLP